jgi:hypothetical protein
VASAIFCVQEGDNRLAKGEDSERSIDRQRHTETNKEHATDHGDMAVGGCRRHLSSNDCRPRLTMKVSLNHGLCL